MRTSVSRINHSTIKTDVIKHYFDDTIQHFKVK